MARPARGIESLARARAALANASSVEQLRQAQALILPLDPGLSLAQTARAIGLSVAWTCRLRNRFIEGLEAKDATLAGRGGRRHQHLSLAQEARLLAPFLARAARGAPLVVKAVQARVEWELGRSVATSTIYRLLHRHGWHPAARPE